MVRTSVFSCALVAFLFAGVLSAAPSAIPPPKIAPAVLAVSDVSWEWDWTGFRKFWGRLLGKTAGVAGLVTLIVAGGVLLVMSAKKRT